MQGRMNKRGISEVVSAILIVLLVIVAAGILWANVDRIISSPMLAPARDCVGMQVDMPVMLERVCYDSAGKLNVDVRRSLDETRIDSIDFVLMDGESGGSGRWRVGEGCEGCVMPGVGEKKIYNINSREVGEGSKLSLLIGSCEIDRKDVGSC